VENEGSKFRERRTVAFISDISLESVFLIGDEKELRLE
jgi:hypothetical protein